MPPSPKLFRDAHVVALSLLLTYKALIITTICPPHSLDILTAELQSDEPHQEPIARRR